MQTMKTVKFPITGIVMSDKNITMNATSGGSKSRKWKKKHILDTY